MTPFWCSVGGGDQERSTELEVTAVSLTARGVSLGSVGGITDLVANDNQRLCVALGMECLVHGTVALIYSLNEKHTILQCLYRN